MIIINVHEAKAKLSEYLDAIERGEHVLICKRNRPVAELRPVAAARTEPRPIGLAKGRLDVPDAFYEPLPEAGVDAFYDGEGRVRRVKVAEGPPSEGEHGRRTTRKRRRRA